MKKYFLYLLIGLFTSCAYLPLSPGKAGVHLADGSTATVKQSQNPQQDTTQVFEQTNTNGVVTRVTTKIGAAQKDTARELGAKLASLSMVVWVGIVVFLFGVASAVYPPLKLVVGSTTTSALLAAAGIVLVILPTLVVGHEVLIMSVAGGVVLLYWFAHRHGTLKGTIEQLTKGK